MHFLRIAAAAALVWACGCSTKETLEGTGTMLVTLPGGQKIQAEVMTHPTDMMRGMMFRDALAPDRGMLFIHGSSGRYTYWMHQVKIPLDIIWMSKDKRVVEISHRTPPCTSKSARECPSYGGHYDAIYVLELAGGMASKYGIKEGDYLSF